MTVHNGLLDRRSAPSPSFSLFRYSAVSARFPTITTISHPQKCPSVPVTEWHPVDSVDLFLNREEGVRSGAEREEVHPLPVRKGCHLAALTCQATPTHRLFSKMEPPS
ncbi:hypothetical protein CMEL01_11213 [Colletotrichum melonis]|uniref:Uncharacterized protein n=1 Tax=Colletotrichum melonis TaxID=1209925 RepID=A0AAI9UZ61_9PEZI|nr:hypothetical protein CMEL01_11213 [Colletotrichum melonis]